MNETVRKLESLPIKDTVSLQVSKQIGEGAFGQIYLLPSGKVAKVEFFYVHILAEYYESGRAPHRP